MRAHGIRRWTVANLAGVLAASLVLAAPVAAAQVYGVTQSSPTPTTIDYSDHVTFRGSYTCVNGVDPADLCPTTTQSYTATFALRPVGGSDFTTVATVTTSFRFTTSSSGCTSTCSVNFSVVWKAGRGAGSISVPAGVFDVRMTTTLTPDAVVLDGGLTIDHEDTTTTYTGGLAGEAGAPLALAATVADEDLGMFAGTSLYLPDINIGASSPVSFALYDATNTTLVAGPVTAFVGGGGTTMGTPSLTMPGAGTYQLRTPYPGNDYYRGSSDLNTVTGNPSTVNTPPTLDLPDPITAEATSPAGAPVSFSVAATDAEDDPDPTAACDHASGSTFALGTTTVTCSVTDADGSTTNGSFTVTVVDTTAPSVTISTTETAGSSGWFNLASNDGLPGLTVDVSTADLVGATALTCTDGGVDVGSLDPGGDSFVLGDGQHALECTAFDGAGNAGFDAVSFDVDQAPPSAVAFVGDLLDGGAYDFWFVPAAPSCTADDAVSGLATCLVSGYSDAVGTHALGATATDVAGNEATATLSYTVLPWTLVGFDGLDMSGWNTAKGGTPVQLRFEVLAGTVEITSVDAVVGLLQAQVGCGDGLALTAVTTASSRSPLRHGGGGFAWSWLAPRQPDTCWQVTVVTADGSSLAALFRLR
ncbi:MAG: HYR domain-containing protein [Chloroflexi bacterium]|nr:HYR domain-containing protein [Chloroflexota bacterium]